MLSKLYTYLYFHCIDLISTFIMQNLCSVVMRSLWDWKPFNSFLFVHICLTLSLKTNFTKVARLGMKIIAIIRSKKSKQQKQKITVFKNTILEFLRLSLNLSFIRRWKPLPLKYLHAIVVCETDWMKFYLPNVKVKSAAPKSDTMKPSWKLGKIAHYCWIY